MTNVFTKLFKRSKPKSVSAGFFERNNNKCNHNHYIAWIGHFNLPHGRKYGIQLDFISYGKLGICSGCGSLIGQQKEQELEFIRWFDYKYGKV